MGILHAANLPANDRKYGKENWRCYRANRYDCLKGCVGHSCCLTIARVRKRRITFQTGVLYRERPLRVGSGPSEYYQLNDRYREQSRRSILLELRISTGS